jgi:hypothetical protein
MFTFIWRARELSLFVFICLRRSSTIPICGDFWQDFWCPESATLHSVPIGAHHRINVRPLRPSVPAT